MRNVATKSDVQVLAPDVVAFAGLSFSPDGNYVYFVRSDKNTTNFRYLYVMPVLGGTARQLIRDIDSPVSFSPDGKQFVYMRGVPEHNNVELRVANPTAAAITSFLPCRIGRALCSAHPGHRTEKRSSHQDCKRAKK